MFGRPPSQPHQNPPSRPLQAINEDIAESIAVKSLKFGPPPVPAEQSTPSINAVPAHDPDDNARMTVRRKRIRSQIRATVHNETMVEAFDRMHRVLFSRRCGVIIGFMLGVITMLLRSMGLDVLQFSPGENEVFFFLCMVPTYMFTGFLALRYVGGYLTRTWLKEILTSPYMHKTVVDFAEHICEDPALPQMIATSAQREPLVLAASHLTGKVVGDAAVKRAAVKLVVAVLKSQGTQAAIRPVVKEIIMSQGLRGGLANFLRDRKLTRPISDVAQAIIRDENLQHSISAFIEKLLSDPGVRKDVKDTVKSILADPQIHSGIVRALYTSMRDMILRRNGPQGTAAGRSVPQFSMAPRSSGSSDHEEAQLEEASRRI